MPIMVTCRIPECYWQQTTGSIGSARDAYHWHYLECHVPPTPERNHDGPVTPVS